MNLLPLVICIVGALLYLLVNHAKVSELGRWMFILGLAFTLYFKVWQ